jgi:hemolysin activation/secretion protein
MRSRDLNVLLHGGFAYRDVRSSNATLSPLFDDHVRALNVGTYVNLLDVWGGYSTLTLDLYQGLNGLGATRLSSTNKSRLTGSGDFTRLDFEATRLQRLSDRFSLQLGASGQTSFNEPLLASEQFALGGYAYDRAFDPAEATGDAALAGKAELRWTAVRRWGPISNLQPYAFYEGGEIWQVTALPGLPQNQTLVSTGLGVRLMVANRITGDLQWAQPVGPDVGQTHSRNARIFFSLTTNF